MCLFFSFFFLSFFLHPFLSFFHSCFFPGTPLVWADHWIGDGPFNWALFQVGIMAHNAHHPHSPFSSPSPPSLPSSPSEDLLSLYQYLSPTPYTIYLYTLSIYSPFPTSEPLIFGYRHSSTRTTHDPSIPSSIYSLHS